MHRVLLENLQKKGYSYEVANAAIYKCIKETGYSYYWLYAELVEKYI